MRRKWVRVMVIVGLILLPFLIVIVFDKLTALPNEITIATGPPGGVYRNLGEELARTIEKNLKIKVHTVRTDGTLENLHLLRAGKVDFGLYQAGTVEILSALDPAVLEKADILPQEPETTHVEFIANLYSQPAHIVVRRDAGIKSPADLQGKTVSLGLKSSGDYAMSLVLLEYFGLDISSFNPKHVNNTKIKQGLLNNTLDAAFIAIGMPAPLFPDIFETCLCDMLSIPYPEALAAKYVAMSQFKIPAGRYRYQSPAAPTTDVHTVAFAAQLLTHSGVQARLVEEVTKLVLSEEFTKKNQLGELFAKGHQFALEKPEFAMHAGARQFYNPELNPLLPADFVQATEGMRSFIVSFLIAVFLCVRWQKQRKVKKRAHKLDRYITLPPLTL